jgi:protein involved in polysaccharide export with SLBB domain
MRVLLAGASAALLALLLASCGPPPTPVDLPPPVQATTMGVGDVFELQIIGEDKLPKEFTVAPNGTVDLPFVSRVKVDGLEPHEIADLVRGKLIAAQVWTNPVVVVNIKAYNSKRVEVLGQVKNPGSLPLEPGMTMVRAISKAGGFNNIADMTVTLRRKVKDKIKSVHVDVQAIIDNEIPDVLLQAGDVISVDQRIM